MVQEVGEDWRDRGTRSRYMKKTQREKRKQIDGSLSPSRGSLKSNSRSLDKHSYLPPIGVCGLLDDGRAEARSLQTGEKG